MKFFTTLIAALAGTSFISAPAEAAGVSYFKSCTSDSSGWAFSLRVVQGKYPFISNIKSLLIMDSGSVGYKKGSYYINTNGKWVRSGYDLVITNPDGTKTMITNGMSAPCRDWY